MRYVDGYLLAVPRKNLAAYRRIASKAGRIWLEYGAVQYVECVGDDLDIKFGLPFPAVVKPKRGETIVFSFIVYKSRAQRDRVNAKVMQDPRIAALINPKKWPFDPKRMSMGGFRTLVDF